MKKPGTYIETMLSPMTKFGDSSLKNEFRNAKRGWLPIMCIFNDPFELVRDLRVINVLAKFENDP